MKLKRIVSLLLAVIMAASLCVISSAEEAKRDFSGYKTYVCLGDSIAAGYRDDNKELDVGLYKKQPYAYHSIVAKAINAKLIQLACSGLRTYDALYMLDGSYAKPDDALSLATLSGIYDMSSKDRAKVRKEVSSADIITLCCGANDYALYPITKALISLSEDSVLDPYVDKFQESIASGGDLAGSLIEFLKAAKAVGKLPKAIATLTSEISSGYTAFINNYPKIVDAIYALNPDVTLVLLGQYFTFFNSSSEKAEDADVDDAVITIKQLISKTIDLANYNVKSQASKHNCVYVNTQGIDCVLHPTELGHKQIAERIIDAIPDRAAGNEKPETPKETKKPDTSKDTEKAKLPFTDVPKGYWAYGDIKYCYENGLMLGYTKTTFSPATTMTRAQLAAVLYRIAGSPDTSKLSEPFDDVADSYWARDEIAWAFSKGVIKGFTETQFNPNAPVSRQQMVAMLYRYASSLCGLDFKAKGDELKGFTDADEVDGYAVDAFSWAVSEGIIKGYTETTLVPDGTLTRAQCATILARFDRGLEKK